jgi:para-nitrobenzyl esterase
MGKQVTAETRYGRVGGLLENGIAEFRGVPFAAPPVEELRFEPPVPPEPWTGVRDATKLGLLPAQTPSRLARVLGDYDLPCGEDCLHLNISTPAVDTARRPVIVWIHGGAFMTGGNAIPWYDGASFARHHGIVFVGINYRLGALGFLHAEGVSPANLGLRDQQAALEWVRDNIEGFGGDPDRVTLIGQSAGAISALALLARDDASALFHRAILQSGRLSKLADRETALTTGESMVAASGLGRDKFRRMPLDDLLKLQVAQVRAGATTFAKTMSPFWPSADGDFIPTNTMDCALRNATNKQFIIGWTRDEMAAFFAGNEQILNGTQAQVSEALSREWGSDWGNGEQFARARVPGATQDSVLGNAINECMFAGSSVDFAESLMTVSPAWLYRFDWAAPGNPFGACHCIEVPFVFNNATDWLPPMLEGAQPEQMRALGGIVQATWARFVHEGDPNHSQLPAWPPYESDKRWTLRIDSIIEAVGDLGGVSLPGRARPVH